MNAVWTGRYEVAEMTFMMADIGCRRTDVIRK
jgi:hypothetical protein